ncbi:MAG: ribosome recycling factor [Syntrophales bacterium]|jgi:ribosome recycling factor|nr:ribosome recycling factor [Syntrophales bacterium]MCK9528214.1 ribosome recycling factor [Syntrophales bacterium]MDX9921362.1 ribosome recycling factor [Syntrophales bacterium]
MTEDIFQDLHENMDNNIVFFEKSLSRVRTGRASLSLVDGIRVDYYGTSTPLSQMATLSIPDSQSVLISPWDKSALGSVEKAIQKSELGLMPSNDGKVIRITIPPLTEERRKELVKVVRKMAEECRIQVRNSRRDANNGLKKLKNDNEISEDDFHVRQEDVQKITDDYIKKVDEILSVKEAEIMEI